MYFISLIDKSFAWGSVRTELSSCSSGIEALRFRITWEIEQPPACTHDRRFHFSKNTRNCNNKYYCSPNIQTVLYEQTSKEFTLNIVHLRKFNYAVTFEIQVVYRHNPILYSLYPIKSNDYMRHTKAFRGKEYIYLLVFKFLSRRPASFIGSWSFMIFYQRQPFDATNHLFECLGFPTNSLTFGSYNCFTP